MVARLREVGVEVGVGIHTGRCQMYGDNLIGMAVNIAARIMALAGPAEILVSESVRDAAADVSADDFLPRGKHDLKGVPGRWQLYAIG